MKIDKISIIEDSWSGYEEWAVWCGRLGGAQCGADSFRLGRGKIGVVMI